MTDPVPSSVSLLKQATGRYYGQGSLGVGANIGKVPAGTLVVAAFLASDAEAARGCSLGEPLVSAGGGSYVVGMPYAGQGSRSDPTHTGFYLGYFFVPALYAEDATLTVSAFHSAVGGWNMITDVQCAAYRGADPAGTVVGGVVEPGGYSTPAVQAAGPGIAIHVCQTSQYGQLQALETLPGGPFGTLEEDDSPGALVQLSAGSYVEDQLAGPTTPRRFTVSPWANWGAPGSGFANIRSAVLAIPYLRGDSTGELVT